MTDQKSLLKKYFKGETTLNEEIELKFHFKEEKISSPEQDILGYFESQSVIPDNLEEEIYTQLKSTTNKKNSIRRRLYLVSSAAAVLVLLLSVYLDFRKNRNLQLENDFFVMEQALFQVSDNLQPDIEEEMLVLWVDDDVEIIIN